GQCLPLDLGLLVIVVGSTAARAIGLLFQFGKAILKGLEVWLAVAFLLVLLLDLDRGRLFLDHLQPLIDRLLQVGEALGDESDRIVLIPLGLQNGSAGKQRLFGHVSHDYLAAIWAEARLMAATS